MVKSATRTRGTVGRAGAGLPPESPAVLARRARMIVHRLARRYPQAAIPLRHASPFQLLIATILSAQSTDAQVNKVTPALFQRYRTPAEFANAGREELERAIHSTGFFRAKARAIQNASRMLLERYGGEIPRTLEELNVLAEDGLLVLAAGIGDVRLIDSTVLTPSSVTRPSQPQAREVLA